MLQRTSLATLAASLVALAACEPSRPTAIADGHAVAKRDHAPVVGTPTVIASGLLFPRGIAFHDGAVYVAEAGTVEGNTTLTVGRCQQVPAPLGPIAGGNTGRISRIDDGVRTTVASGLPSSRNQLGDVTGPMDVAFVGPRLYALVNGGCSHGHVDVPSAVLRVEDDGSWEVAADLSAWIMANPAANPEPGDFEPDGDWYSMVASGGVLYLGEANHGNIVEVRPNPGHVERVVDVSAAQGHVVPTAVAVARGEILVGELTPFPVVPGAAELLRYRRNGSLLGTIGGFTAMLGVETDHEGNIYVLESFTCPTAAPCFPSPGSGRVVRVGRDGTREVVVTGLSFATALRLGPDGALYISNFGFGPPNMGQLLRVPLSRN